MNTTLFAVSLVNATPVRTRHERNWWTFVGAALVVAVLVGVLA